MTEMLGLAAEENSRLLELASLFGYRAVIRQPVEHAPRQENTLLAHDYGAPPHNLARVLGVGGGS